MPYSGYPTPDELLPQTFRCVEVYIPDCVNDEFFQVLLGQISELTNDWYWKSSGTLTPQQCAFLWAQSMALTNADGEICMDCDGIADCIDTSTTVQNSIQNYLSSTNQNGGTGNPSQPINQTFREENLVPVGALCTEANKFAMALSVVQRLNTYAEDFFQQVETITNAAEYAVTLADNAGIFSGAPASALETAAWLQDTIEENYTSAYTAATEEALACAVYCAFNGCDLSFDNIFDAYQDVLSVTLPDVDSLDTVLNFLIGLGALADLQIVGQMHLYILSLLRWGSSWVELGSWEYFKLIVGAEKNNEVPVPVSCDCTPTGWAYYQDFTQGLGNWTLIGNTTQQNGVGLVSYDAAGQQNCLTLLETTASYNWQYLQVKYTRTGGQHGADSFRVIFWTAYPSSTGRVNSIDIDSEGDGTFDKCYDITPFNIDRKQISVFIEGNQAGQVIIQSIKVWGTDSNTPPSPLPDNSSIGCD